ncbi:MAG: folate-binding protein [Aquificota bacterium]|jgi:folate-binding protein YgfZ|nr:folate-binding protein [Aquificaceae bacterium]MDM7266093.1 folate-binding protein [Aquificaceae bacterium]
MHWIRLKNSKIRVYGKEGKLLPKGMAEEHTAFLHNLLSNDIKGMANYTMTYNLWLRQNGFPIGEFYVLKLGNSYLLDTPLDKDFVLEEFSRLKLSMRVYFEALDMDHVFVFGEGARDFILSSFGVELKEGEVKEMDGVLVVRNDIRLREEGYDIIGGNLNLNLKEGEEIKEEDFEHERILRMVPKLGKELKEGFSPLEACLLKYAISLTKGCYVGQEAIARVHYRGRPARTLALFEGEELSEDQVIKSGEKKVGIITSVSPKDHVALGYILRSSLQASLSLEDGKEIKLLKTCD